MDSVKLHSISVSAAAYATERTAEIAGRHLSVFDEIYDLMRQLLTEREQAAEREKWFKEQITRNLKVQADTVKQYTDMIEGLKRQIR